MSTHGEDAGLRAALGHELNQLQQDVQSSARAQFLRSRRWDGLGTVLNVLTAMLAGLAGVSTLAQVAGALVSGVLALAAAGLAAVSSALGTDKKSAASATAANAYIEMRDMLRHVRVLDLPAMPPGQVRQQIRELTDRIHAINKSAPIPGMLVRRKVRRDQEREARSGMGGGGNPKPEAGRGGDDSTDLAASVRL
jgi:hypothetical protein